MKSTRADDNDKLSDEMDYAVEFQLISPKFNNKKESNMKQINFDQPINTIYGKQMQGPNQEPATLRTLCIEAVLGVFQDEQNLSGGKKLKRYLLAQKIQSVKSELAEGEKAVEMNIEDLAEIKACVGKMYGPAVVGPVFQMLEGEKS